VDAQQIAAVNTLAVATVDAQQIAAVNTLAVAAMDAQHIAAVNTLAVAAMDALAVTAMDALAVTAMDTLAVSTVNACLRAISEHRTNAADRKEKCPGRRKPSFPKRQFFIAHFSISPTSRKLMGFIAQLCSISK
jgi:hypothetical protein